MANEEPGNMQLFTVMLASDKEPLPLSPPLPLLLRSDITSDVLVALQLTIVPEDFFYERKWCTLLARHFLILTHTLSLRDDGLLPRKIKEWKSKWHSIWLLLSWFVRLARNNELQLDSLHLTPLFLFSPLPLLFAPLLSSPLSALNFNQRRTR